MNNLLIKNIDKVHTTNLGLKRIEKCITGNDLVELIKKIIIDKNTNIYKKGKNFYCENNNLIITINSSNYCIITVHKKR